MSFEVLPLSRERIEAISEMNLGPRKNDFIHLLYQYGLVNELNNTLLLALAIHIFQCEKKIPMTRTKIVKQIVKEVENWEGTKITRLETKIVWKVKKDLLKKIAFAIRENAYGYTFPENQLGQFLAKNIHDYEKTREVQKGLDKSTLLKELSTTGFIRYDDFGLTFNAPIFLDHFASIRLSELYQQNSEVLKGKIDKVPWHEAIVATASKLSDPSLFIREVYQEDPIKAAACLVENQNIEESLIKEIIANLEKTCSSKFPTVRNRSLYYLARIEKKYTQDVFKRLLNSNHEFVKMIAIEELSKNADSEAAKIVNENIGWDEGGFEIGDTTQGAIARALANLNDETSHLKIIEIWKKKVDIFTTEDCRTALLSLVYRKRLTPKIRDELIEFFVSKPQKNDGSLYSKLVGIADILIALEDESIFPRLLMGFDSIDDHDFIRRTETSRILSSFGSSSALSFLVEGSLDPRNPKQVRVGLTEAVARAKNSKVELSIFGQLLSDKDPLIRREAIIGLSKFSSYEVKDMLLKLVNDPDSRVHVEAINLLGDLGLLSIIAEEKLFPKLFVPETLFAQIRKHNLKEFLPFLDKFQKKWAHNEEMDRLEHRLIDLAHTYLVLGKTDQMENIIHGFYINGKISFKDEYAYAALANLCPVIGGPSGLKILNDIYQAVLDARKEGDKDNLFKSMFMDDNYVENLQKFGSSEAIDRLIKLSEKFAEEGEPKAGLLFERAMRAIVSLAPKLKEDWLLGLIGSHPELKGCDLHRAVEALGVLGTDKSISLIKKIANDNFTSEYILDTCLTSLEYINLKKGIMRFLEDKDVLDV